MRACFLFDDCVLTVTSQGGRRKLALWNLSRMKRKWKSLSVQLFVTPWTIQSMEFSRPEYWSGWPFPSPGDLPNPRIEARSPALQVNSLPAEPQGKAKNTRVSSLSLFQQIFPTQELIGGSCIAGGFFNNWSTREVQLIPIVRVSPSGQKHLPKSDRAIHSATLSKIRLLSGELSVMVLVMVTVHWTSYGSMIASIILSKTMITLFFLIVLF